MRTSSTTPNSGINRNGNNIQIIFGMKVAETALTRSKTQLRRSSKQ